MKSKNSQFLLVLTVIGLCVCGAAAQVSTFSDPAVEYSFSVPEEKWTMVVRPSATNPNVEYVYGDRRDGYFTIRKLTVTRDAVMSDVIEGEAQSARFKPGYVENKQETFTGKLKGNVYNFEYVAASRPMAGRYYFLRADPTTVYVLRFLGGKDSMRQLRTQTDQIARTFGVK
jgi:hypothetical protein